MEYVPQRFNKDFINFSFNNEPILIAILDTGVDPLAHGLTKCPDGSNKIIDIIDCTGSDIVNTSTIKQFDSLPQKIKDTIGPNINEVFYGTRSLRTFISNRSYKDFDEKQQKVIDDVILCVYTYKFDNKFVTVIDSDACIWKMNEYNINQECGSINLGDNLYINFGVHVYDEGKQTSLIFDTGSHATHVGGIVAGYFPDNQKQNGINPNAKLLSLKIGDSRVDGMETSSALCRALEEMIKHNCRLANYSFGESVKPNSPNLDGLSGKFIDMLSEYSIKHNLIFVTSAGNSGPTLMTVGAPRMCSEYCISVGAYTDKILLEKLYNLSDNGFEAGAYQWSSRGPLFNKSMGVDILATGCALTSHPTWYKSNMNMCNGTSMACPNAVGILSLILQGYPGNGKDLPFYWVKKFVENSCAKVSNTEMEHFTQGHGLICTKEVEHNARIRQDNYCYTLTSANANTTAKQVGEFIHIDSNIFAGLADQYYCHNIFINIKPEIINSSNDNIIQMTNFRKILCLRCDDVNESEDENFKLNMPNKVIVDSRNPTVRVQLMLKKNIQCVSTYIKFYEEHDINNFVACYPINIVKYVKCDLQIAWSPKLKPGNIKRKYIMPQHNTFNIIINNPNEYEHNVLYIEIAKLSNIDKYGDSNRLSEFYCMNKKDLRKNMTVLCVPGCVYEIVAYLPWSYGSNGMIGNPVIVVDNYNTNTNIDKTFVQVGNYAIVNTSFSDAFYTNIDQERQKNITANMTKAKITNIISSYVPYEESTVNGTLTLKYKLNKHIGKCIYYVDTCNQVYNSVVTSSANIFGYCDGKQMFMGNYVPKSYDQKNGIINEVIIKISDNDAKILESFSGLVLNVKRTVSTTNIDVNITGFSNTISKYDTNVVTKIMLTKDQCDELEKTHGEIYYNDTIECEILNNTITFVNRSIKKSQPIQDNFVVNFCKNFSLLTSRDELYKFDMKLKEDKEKILFADYPLAQMISSLTANNIQNNTALKKTNVGTTSQITNEKQKFYDQIIQNKLENTAPFCAYKYLWKIMDPTDQSVSLDDVITSLDKITSNKSYWTNLSNTDIAKLYVNVLDAQDVEKKYTTKKRKYSYLVESEFGY